MIHEIKNKKLRDEIFYILDGREVGECNLIVDAINNSRSTSELMEFFEEIPRFHWMVQIIVPAFERSVCYCA